MHKHRKTALLLGCLIFLVVGGLFLRLVIGRQEFIQVVELGNLNAQTNHFSVTIPKGFYHELDIRFKDITAYTGGVPLEGQLSIDGVKTLFDLAKVTQRNCVTDGKQTDWGFIIAESRHDSLLKSGERCAIEVTLPQGFPMKASLQLMYAYRYRDK
jgi:hypothetical protein